MSASAFVPARSPDFAQGICRSVDLSARTADVQLAASPSLLEDVPLARHITSLATGDLVLVMLPAPDRPAPDTLLVAVLGPGLPRASFTIPLAGLSLALTNTPQNVTEYTQTLNSLFAAMTGITRHQATDWSMYVMLTHNFASAGTIVEVSLWHFWSGAWQYHPTIHTNGPAHLGSPTKMLYGPWPTTTVADSFYVRARWTAGTASTFAPCAALVFRQD